MAEFALASYAAIFFFVIGLRLAWFRALDLNFPKWIFIFIVIAGVLSFVVVREPVKDRLLISAIWTSVMLVGFRFGRKIL